MFRCYLFVFFALTVCPLSAQQKKEVTITNVDSGWARNSINTVVFRKNSLATHNNIQFISYYNAEGSVVVGKRKFGDVKWQLKTTKFKGNTNDAHNTISIALDGDGYLHIAWDHHNNPLHYSRSIKPLSLELAEPSVMIGESEKKVSYPEFYKMPGGDLLFFYRDGGSGNGNLVINKYIVKTKKWERLHSNLIDGERQRNAYWQACVDGKGVIHLSWVWRESPDVASNHDMCYARSADGGKTWTTSSGIKYQIPVTAASAEYASIIPQKSELINQTSMYADISGNVYIATYWREKGEAVPQYHLVLNKDKHWKTLDLGFRKTDFSLSGAGTKRIPISRPQIISWKKNNSFHVGIIFRDAERDNKVSLAVCNDIEQNKWEVKDLAGESVGSWEPTYDTELWKEKGVLNLFVQRVEQADTEGSTVFPPQMIKVLSWRPGY